MKKLLFVPLLIASLLAALPVFAADGVAVIDVRNAMLQTQFAKDTFKALEEETEFAANVERVTLLQSEFQSIAEKLQKDGETLSQEEIADMQKDLQAKREEIEFVIKKVQAEQSEAADKIYRELNPSLQKILNELIAAKQVKLLLNKENIYYNDPTLDLTDDVTSMLDVAAADGADNN
jgi:outer membrane protein